MKRFLVEIQPKRVEFDPQAVKLGKTLMESGVPAAQCLVQTRRLYKIEGAVTSQQVGKAADELLVDPVIETARAIDLDDEGRKNKAVRPGLVLDIWPKKGVTDPVGETVEKGLRDLGWEGVIHASSANRYLFPKMKDMEFVKKFALGYLANELIHDIHIHQQN